MIDVPARLLASSRYPAVLDPVISVEYEVDEPVPGQGAVRASNASIAFDGQNYLAVWDTNEGIFSTRIAPDGSLVDGTWRNLYGGTAQFSAVAASGAQFLVVFRGCLETCGPTGLLVPSDGSQPGPAFKIADDESVQGFSAASDGTGFVVAWTGYYEVRAAAIGQDGSVLAESLVRAPLGLGSPMDVAVAFGGGRYLAVWADQRDGMLNTFGARIAPDGTLLDPPSIDGDGTVLAAGGFRIGPTPSLQLQQAVAFSGGQFLVAWVDRSPANVWNIYASRVNPDKTVLDASGVLTVSTAEQEQWPQLAHDGTRWHITWWANQRTYAGLMTPGVPGVTASVQVSTTVQAGSPALACHAGGCAALWIGGSAGGPDYDSGSALPASAAGDGGGMAASSALGGSRSGAVPASVAPRPPSAAVGGPSSRPPPSVSTRSEQPQSSSIASHGPPRDGRITRLPYRPSRSGLDPSCPILAHPETEARRDGHSHTTAV